MSPGVAIVRADICHDCPTPCARQHDAEAHRDPCAACEVGRWGRHDCQPEIPLGDRLTAEIERRVLLPIETALPAAAPIVEAVRRCGGCTHARHQLGSDEPHPDPGVVV